MVPKPIIGGLNDGQGATERPASFGAIRSQAQAQAMPTNLLGLQRNRRQRNKVRPCLAPSSTHLNQEQLVGLSRGVSGENNRFAVVSITCPRYMSLLTKRRSVPSAIRRPRK